MSDAARRPFRMLVTAITLALAVIAGGGLLAARVDAAPNGELRYPAGATATRFQGQAFDVCAAPSTRTMRAWLSSPYRAVGIYISGNLRACRQPNLTASWVREVSAMGWKLIPIDVGRQAPCTRYSARISSDGSVARRQGLEAGRASVAAAKALGLLPGSALYSDIEYYHSPDGRCADDVNAYLNGWTRALHAAGYLSGVYGNLGSAVRGVTSAQDAANNGKAPAEPMRPDMLWSADWDTQQNLTTWSGVNPYQWAAHQRMKQYRGDHRATYGGITLTIDSNIVDAAVATVAYGLPTPTGIDLVSRAAPVDSAAKRAPGARLDVVCATHASLSAKGAWLQTADGVWVPKAALTGNAGLAAVADLLPTCATPYQVKPGKTPLRLRAADTASSPGSLAGGTLAWIVCEQAGVAEGRAGYWQRLETGQWVSGSSLLRANNTGDAAATPACRI
jgi:hypothetical protein